MPDGVTDRRADVWESLVAVADTAGGHWPKTARATAETDATANRGQAQHRRAAAAGYPSSLQRPGPDAHQRHPDRTEPDGGGTVGLHPPRRPARRARPRDPARQIRHRAEVPAQWWRTTLQRVFADPVRGCVVPVSLCRRRNPEERDLSVSAVSAVSPPVGDPGDATGATDATDLPEAGDLPYEPPAPNRHPNGDAPLCSGPGCPNKLLSTEAKAAGKCRPCRGRAAASARDGAR